MSVRFAIIKKQLDIPLPIYLEGYFNRKDPATEIHDPLNISCFYLTSADKEMAVFGLDLLGIYFGTYDKLVQAIKEKVNRPQLDIVISSAHTHSAPGFRGAMPGGHTLNLDKLFDEIVSKAVIILTEAPEIAAEATLRYSEKPIENVGANRRNKDIKVNTVLRKLAFDFDGKEALIINFPCHPTHMSARNLLVSKDFQGAAMDELAGQGFIPMFLQGACGDISTRFTRVDQTFEDMARIGHLFAEEIKDQLPEDSFTIDDFSYQEHCFTIEKKTYQSEEYYLNEIEKHKANLEANRASMSAADLRILETAVEGINVEYQYSLMQQYIDTNIRCGILTLGEKLAFVFLPFELFSRISDYIVANSPVEHLMVVGYSFDGLGYLPDEASFEQSGYEVLSCVYAKGSGEVVGRKVVELLAEAGACPLNL